MFRTSIKGADVNSRNINDRSVDDRYPVVKVYKIEDFDFFDGGVSKEQTYKIQWEYNTIPILWVFLSINGSEEYYYQSWSNTMGDSVETSYTKEEDMVILKVRSNNSTGTVYNVKIKAVIISNNLYDGASC